MKKRVGLTANWVENKADKRDAYGRWGYSLHQSYVDLMVALGVLPVMMVPSTDPAETLEDLDLLVMTGGGDPDPSLFGRRQTYPGPVRLDRPVWDISVYRSARKLGLPVLGICLGMQLIGIAEGVALIQDIPSVLDRTVGHQGESSASKQHLVELVEGTALAEALGPRAVVVTDHHQALEEIPAGFRIAGETSDGVIEAIESEDGAVIGVQWHPERDSTGPAVVRAALNMRGDRG